MHQSEISHKVLHSGLTKVLHDLAELELSLMSAPLILLKNAAGIYCPGEELDRRHLLLAGTVTAFAPRCAIFVDQDAKLYRIQAHALRDC